MEDIQRITNEEAKDYIEWHPSMATPYNNMQLSNCVAFTLNISSDGFETVKYYLKKKD